MANYQHGGGLDRAVALYGGQKRDWLDLSTGINPVPYPACDVPQHIWHRLPDRGLMDDCLEAARTYYNVPDDAAIVSAPGTQAIIQRLPELWPSPYVAIVSPTYNEYERCYLQAGSKIIQTCDLSAALDAANLVVAGNPNNPDGRGADADMILQAAKSGSRIIVDEAFGDVAPDASVTGQAAGDRILVLKSFGKFFGLAGLRLGFAIGSEEQIARLRSALGPWAVSGPALFTGASAMRDDAWIKNTRTHLKAKRERLEAMLSNHDFVKIGATDLFVTGSRIDSKNVANILAQNHILVREFDYAPTWIRFGLPQTEGDFDRLDAALSLADG